VQVPFKSFGIVSKKETIKIECFLEGNILDRRSNDRFSDVLVCA